MGMPHNKKGYKEEQGLGLFAKAEQADTRRASTRQKCLTATFRASEHAQSVDYDTIQQHTRQEQAKTYTASTDENLIAGKSRTGGHVECFHVSHVPRIG